MTIQGLIYFIDLHTDSGTAYTREPWGEGIGIEEEGVTLLQSLNANEWLALYGQLTGKSYFWLRCLIELLDEVGTQNARQMIVHLALNSTEDVFFEAIGSIRDFRNDVCIYTWLKLKNRSAEISGNKLNSKFITRDRNF